MYLSQEKYYSENLILILNVHPQRYEYDFQQVRQTLKGKGETVSCFVYKKHVSRSLTEVR